MNARLPRRVAVVCLGFMVAVVGIVAWEPRAGGEGFWYFVVIGGSLSVVWGVVGALVASRDPRNPIGWIILAVGIAFGLWGLLATLGPALVVHDRKSGIGVWLAWASHVLVGALILVPFVFLLFPTGRVLTPRWRWVGRLLAVGGVAAIVSTALTPDPTLNVLADIGLTLANPAGIEALAELGGLISFLGVLTVLVMGVLAVVSLVLRFRRSSGDERQQIRWLAFVGGAAATVLILQFLLAFLEGAVGGPGEGSASWIFGTLFLSFVATLAVGIPVATGVAMLKYHLYDLDIVITKTVQYGVLVAAFVGVGAVVLALPVLIMGTGFDPGDLPVLALGAALALVFVWLRRPAGRLAGRIVYGRRATPYEVLTTFSERVGTTYSAEDVLPRMAAVLGEGTGASRATVWLRIGGELRPAATWPAAAEVPTEPAADAADVVHQGEPLGALSVDMPPNDPMTPAKRKLVEDLAAQAGPVLRNVRLIEELRDSRRRLVAAQDLERRKIERNIHDGAQQQLVALAVQLKLAEGLVERDPARARELLTSVQASTGEALEDLRDLARGIYPPLLADRGLVPALEAQARKGAVPTAVMAEGVGRYHQDVESAVYFCCLEALNNVAKYAEASHAAVRLLASNGSIAFHVTDDGRGFDPSATRSGTGLQGMRDRVDAVGGTLRILSTPGEGTEVTGSVPVGGERA